MMTTFICTRCHLRLPEQFQAITFARAMLCRWCHEQPSALPLVDHTDDQALSIAQVVSWVLTNRPPRKWKAAWGCW